MRIFRIEVAIAALVLAPLVGYAIAYVASTVGQEQPRLESATARTGALPGFVIGTGRAGA